MIILPCCSVLSDGVCLSELKGLLTYLLTYLLTCFFHLRRLRSVRRQLGRDVMARAVAPGLL